MANKKYIAELYSLYEEKMQDYIVTDDFTRIRRKIINEIEALNNNLKDEQKNQLQEILELEYHKEALEEEQVFIFAFRLAMNLIFDGVVDGKGDCLCKEK